MKKITVIRKEVCILGNQLHKEGHNKRNSFIIAWNTVKNKIIFTKIAGVTYKNRQEALKKLLLYSKEAVSITFLRDYNNIFDINAVSILVNVFNKGNYPLGYLNKQKASLIAPLLDKGLIPKANLISITGKQYNLYGANIEIELVA